MTNNQKSMLLYTAITAVVLAALFGAVTFANASITSQLDLGSMGYDVTAYQTYLSKNPNIYPSGLVTGYFGELTQSGTEKFQINQGIVSEGTPETTGFGRVGPQTLARVNSLMGGVYIQNSGGGDVNAPLMYNEMVVVDKNEATISWATSEAAMGRVMYATEWPFLYATAESVSSNGYNATAKIEIKNLKSNTTYNYVRESIDSSGNIMWTTHHTFHTK